ncbi:gamma-glutamyltransferase [Benzoatithermus flavus]|uniref:Glutathione hydrolase proenzyme n=1 Tax=Benzoatithermus flavus TaxID=3108223 RepID=A0ABU8XLS4_9PROT
MRDFELPGRSTAYAQNGMAATSHPLATLVAVDVLRAGGNAVDAAIAAVAVLGVVEPHQTGIGGDCFALYAPASGGVVALNGSGRAPAAMTIERLASLGVTTIGNRSPHSVTVPGAVAGWAALLDAYGTRTLGELLQPAIRCAEDGFPVTPRVAWDWRRHAATLEYSQGGRDYYLPGGRPPEEGRIVRLPALARTLRRIADEGPRVFYEGELAARMVASLQTAGGLHTEADFAAAAAEFVTPVHTTYRGDVVVYECPPNGQGIVALLLLNILERFDPRQMAGDGALRLHLLAEATKLAFRDRDAALADPAQAEVPTMRLLDKAYARALAERIDPERAMTELPRPLLEPHPDTIYLTVVDRDLNAISFINSLYDGFGSGLVCSETGVLFHSRGRAFRLDPAHPNAIAPGKRPMHTIIPGLAFKGGELWCSFGVIGGDYQPVGHAHLITRLVDDGLDPQAALDAPRIMAYPCDLEAEAGIGRAARAGLIARGHRVVDTKAPLGGGQVILVDRRRGVLIGGSDPRKDGLALGF